MKRLIVLFVFGLWIQAQAYAQIHAPEVSPPATLTQIIGLTEVKIEYSRPGLKGRKMFGGFLPYGQMWRTGANASTKITISDDVQIQDNELPAGTYALYTIPEEEEWTIILHKNLSHWGTGGKDYNKDEDVFRFKVKPTSLTEKVETFTIDINDIQSNSASIELRWENTKVSFLLGVDTDAKVMADIKQKMKGVSGTTYYQAARYYHETGKDANQALEWVQAAIELEGEKFWMLRLKALILADLKRYKKAIKEAEQSSLLAKEAGNDNYVKMNDESIREWERLLSGVKKE
jgi:hypothetical protein